MRNIPRRAVQSGKQATRLNPVPSSHRQPLLSPPHKGERNHNLTSESSPYPPPHHPRGNKQPKKNPCRNFKFCIGAGEGRSL